MAKISYFDPNICLVTLVTVQPSSAAVARPVPAVPPVMRTTFSAKTGGEDVELMLCVDWVEVGLASYYLTTITQ